MAARGGAQQCTKEVIMTLEGSTAPDFSLDGSDGRRHSLADYRGTTCVIFFYPKDSTPG
jgi:peroxiredoxin Q/BCP